jgi:SAM-dependent methyltransferase
MFAVVGDLAVPSEPNPSSLSGPEFNNFDLAVVGGGFHHFEDPELAAARLVERLRPGGVLLIWDFLPHGDDYIHDAHHTVAHHGFTEERLKNLYEKAGAAKNFKLDIIGAGIVFGQEQEGSKGTMRRTVFLSRGEKA